MRTALVALLSVFGGLAGYYFIARDSILGQQLGFRGGEDLGRLAIGYVAILIGAFLGTAFRRLLTLQGQGVSEVDNILLVLKSIFNQIDFWLGVLGSPIVLALIVKGIEKSSLGTLLLLCLENGFLASSTVEQFVKRRGGSAVASKAAAKPKPSLPAGC